MQRLKRKQLQQLRIEKELKAMEQKSALRHLIKSDERMEIMLNFSEQFLSRGSVESLSEYSPTQISRLVFDRELQLIKGEFSHLPGGEVKMEHFIVIMLRVMGFPFEKSPLYMVGLKDMFNQIVEEGSEAITYSAFFHYILGELVSIKEEEQNTQFQVQIQQRKKQDYLLHDNGIKRIRYSKDTRMVFSLDERAHAIKIYDHDMKNVAKFAPKKEKHANKFPFILDFDYSEIAARIGVVLSDDTISTVHLPSLLSKTQAQFDLGALNEVVFGLPTSMRAVFFIQMLNKWLTVSESGLGLYLFDMERVRSQPEKVMSRLSINTNELKVNMVLQVVPLSCICIVAGNEVLFYNQSLTDVRFSKFVHVEQVQHFKYSDEKNQFYLCGREKSITIFSISRSGHPSKIWTFGINKLITDFEVFPYFDTIVIADENNEIRLTHESTRTVYQQINYDHIVKSRDKSINISKISKNEFAIYQTYQIIMSQEKIAIERGIEYSFLPLFYFDRRKEELFLSVNGQILAFSILSGEIRKSYSRDSSNLDRHSSFFIGPKTPLFVLDNDFSLYQVYTKEHLSEGENRSYKKKITADEVVGSAYDEDMQNLMIVSRNTITQVRNDRNNNFNIVNGIFMEGFSNITRTGFCPASKIITLLTADQTLYQLRNYEHHIENSYKFIFPRDTRQHEEGLILNFHYDSHYDVFLLFTNKNEVYWVERSTGQQFYFNIEEHLPAKLKQQKFTNMRYQIVEEKRGFEEHYILLTDDSGILIQFPLSKIYEQFQITSKQQAHIIKPMFKETQIISNHGIACQQIQLSEARRLSRSYTEVGLMKAHEKGIALAVKLRLQVSTTLTVSIDGYIRLWNEQYDLLFSLKIPSLVRLAWNMGEIEQIKNKKSIDQLLAIFQEYYHEATQENRSPVQTYQKSKRLKQQRAEIPRINLNDPIRIDIENKDIEEIVMQQTDYSYFSSTEKSRTHQFFHTTQKVYPHPWRTKREFLKIYEKASPPHKYKQRIPQDLLQMRSSLDMTEKIKQVPTYKEAELILPQLTLYEAERPQQQEPKQKQVRENVRLEETGGEGENFQSCLYVKSERRKKKINQFDEIDKEFKKKEMVLTARKWVPKKRKERTNSVLEIKSEAAGVLNEGKPDPIKSIQKIFEEHNRECMETKKGRLIKIPKINLNKDFY